MVTDIAKVTGIEVENQLEQPKYIYTDCTGIAFW